MDLWLFLSSVNSGVFVIPSIPKPAAAQLRYCLFPTTPQNNPIPSSPTLLPETCNVLVVGGGPAGLHAVELASAAGLRTILADRMRSVGRKFLVAGRGGLNLTHAEPLENFSQRYGEPQTRWRALLAQFSPDDLRAWAHELGIETFVGTSRRVFPTDKHAAPLLRRWIERLRAQGVSFRVRHALHDFHRSETRNWTVTFSHDGLPVLVYAHAIIFALGGASWPQTGSNGTWIDLFAQKQIPLTPFAPANSGYEVAWPPAFLAAAEGLPLKNIVATARDTSVAGELLVTRYGLEGGAIYQLGPILRTLSPALLTLDLKPSFTSAQLHAKLGPHSTVDAAAQAWRVSLAARELLRTRGPFSSSLHLAETAKAFPIELRGPRPLTEAISSAGGVSWESLDEHLMLRDFPGAFCAGEMIDWEAPTGGYLLQGCFSTGTTAARGAINYVKDLLPSKNPKNTI